MLGDLSNATMLDSSPDKGYIGPPAWIDISGDQNCDIIVNSVEAGTKGTHQQQRDKRAAGFLDRIKKSN